MWDEATREMGIVDEEGNEIHTHLPLFGRQEGEYPTQVRVNFMFVDHFLSSCLVLLYCCYCLC